MNKMTEERLAKLKQLEQKATPRPWSSVAGSVMLTEALDTKNFTGTVYKPDNSNGQISITSICGNAADLQSQLDATFIATIRNELTELLEDIERLQKYNDAISKRNDNLTILRNKYKDRCELLEKALRDLLALPYFSGTIDEYGEYRLPGYTLIHKDQRKESANAIQAAHAALKEIIE